MWNPLKSGCIAVCISLRMLLQQEYDLSFMYGYVCGSNF